MRQRRRQTDVIKRRKEKVSRRRGSVEDNKSVKRGEEAMMGNGKRGREEERWKDKTGRGS